MAQNKLFTISNLLTLSRLLLGLIVFFLLFYSENIYAIIVIIIAGLTDILDGYFARKLNQETEIGKKLDPIVDKIFICFIVLSIIIKYSLTFWLYALAVGIPLYIIFGKYYFKKIKKPLFIGKVFIWVQLISLSSFILDFPYKWIFFYITMYSALLMGIIYAVKIVMKK